MHLHVRPRMRSIFASKKNKHDETQQTNMTIFVCQGRSSAVPDGSVCLNLAFEKSMFRKKSMFRTSCTCQESAETLAFRVDKAWRQRCSQRFRNILDMIAKKAAGLF